MTINHTHRNKGKIPKRKESLDFRIFVQKYTILKYFQYTLHLSD